MIEVLFLFILFLLIILKFLKFYNKITWYYSKQFENNEYNR